MIKKEVAIIIPTYNERDNIALLIKKISSIFKKSSINGLILIVDDNSPDGTGEIAKKLGKKYKVEAIIRKKEKGYGNSVREGFDFVIKNKIPIAVTMDADFSHNPEIIPEMIGELKAGNDVVIGSRRVKHGRIVGWSFWRHLCSFSAGNFSRFLLGLKTRDVTSGFRAYRAEVLKRIPLGKIRSNGYSFLEEILFYVESAGSKIKEVPITFKDRSRGKSKLSKKEILSFFINILRLKIILFIHKYERLLKFLTVGITGIFVNMFFLWLFKNKINLSLELSSIIAIELSVLSNFVLNDAWTFRMNRKTIKIYRFLKYNVSVIFGIGINFLVLLILTNFFGFYYLLANYFFSSRWAWA